MFLGVTGSPEGRARAVRVYCLPRGVRRDRVANRCASGGRDQHTCKRPLPGAGQNRQRPAVALGELVSLTRGRSSRAALGPARTIPAASGQSQTGHQLLFLVKLVPRAAVGPAPALCREPAALAAQCCTARGHRLAAWRGRLVTQLPWPTRPDTWLLGPRRPPPRSFRGRCRTEAHFLLGWLPGGSPAVPSEGPFTRRPAGRDGDRQTVTSQHVVTWVQRTLPALSPLLPTLRETGHGGTEPRSSAHHLAPAGLFSLCVHVNPPSPEPSGPHPPHLDPAGPPTRASLQPSRTSLCEALLPPLGGGSPGAARLEGHLPVGVPPSEAIPVSATEEDPAPFSSPDSTSPRDENNLICQWADLPSGCLPPATRSALAHSRRSANICCVTLLVGVSTCLCVWLWLVASLSACGFSSQ